MAKNQCKPFVCPTIGLNTQLDQKKINKTITASSFQPAFFFSLPVALSYFTINCVRHHASLVYNHNCLYNGFSLTCSLHIFVYLLLLSFISIYSIFSFFDCRLCQLFFFLSSLTRENSLFACIRQVISRRRFSFSLLVHTYL